MGNIFLFVILFVYGFAVILMCCVALKNKKPKNKVHFYVARDKDGFLYLFLGKPSIWEGMLESDNYILIGDCSCFPIVGLGAKDYANLKYEDTPVEVFLNMDE